MTDEQFKMLATACRYGGSLWMPKGDDVSLNRQLLDGLVLEGLLAAPISDAAHGNLKWTVTADGRVAVAERMRPGGAAA
jgi:hypothetical protein